MRKNLYGLLLGMTLIPCGYAATIAGSSGIYFKGTILARTCDVKDTDQDITINLGDHDRRLFPRIGSVSPSAPLNVTLINCQPNPHTNNIISLSFRGNTDDNDRELLQLTNGSDVANGIAIELLDNNGQRIKLNDTLNIPMLQGETPLPPVKFRYRATKVPVTTGAANAILQIILRYEE